MSLKSIDTKAVGIYPTPLHEHDVTQGQFLKGV